jgi:hypothetical protein
MKTKITTLLLTLAFTSCDRSRSRDSEVEALRREVESLKAATVVAPSSTPSFATPQKPSEAYRRFIAESRRMTTALGSGISFDEFHKRFVEIAALTQEALPTLPNLKAKELTLDFAVTLEDAHKLWAFKIETDNTYIAYAHVQGAYMYSGDERIGDRWRYELHELISRYDLKSNGTLSDRPGSASQLFVSGALQRVLNCAQTAFLELERYKPDAQ